MATLSAAVGWKGWIQWATAQEPVNLWVIVEGKSGTARKTTTMRTAAGLVARATEFSPDGEDEHPLNMRGVSHVSNTGLLEMIGTPDAERAKRWNNQPPPAYVLEWDEFGAILGNPGQVKGEGYLGMVRATLMELYGGRHGGTQTKNGKLVQPSRCSISLIGTMTREEIEKRMSVGLMRDGFLGRFILVPYPGRERTLAIPPIWTSLDEREATSLAMFLRRVAYSTTLLGNVFDRLTEEGRRERIDWYDRTIRRLDANIEDGGDEIDIALSEAMARLQSTAMKVAAVLAVSDMDPDEGGLSKVEITEEHVAGGNAFVEHALQEVESIARSAQSRLLPAEDKYAEAVRNYLRKRPSGKRVSRSEMTQRIGTEGLNAERRWKVIESLHSAGELMIHFSNNTTGRPKYEVEWLGD